MGYTVYGIPSSGSPVALASGVASGTVSVPVSGYDSYTLAATASTLWPSEVFESDGAVTVVFGRQQDFYKVLWAIFQYIGVAWGNAGQCDMPEDQFQSVIDWQVGLDPCYGVYYAAAVAEYSRLFQVTGSEPAALARLFAENATDPPKLPDVQKYVLAELMKWQVAFGGFRAFGPPYVNYSGWMGNGTFNQSPPPYRALPDE